MAKASVLVEALPYIQDFSGSVVLIKLGGSVMEIEANLDSLMDDVAFMRSVGIKVVIVHGGGKAISKAIKSSGHQPQFLEGLRVTDEVTMEIVRHTLNNVVNPDLVSRLQKRRTNARPLHGNWLFSAKKITNPDRGYVGQVVSVDIRAVMEMIDAGIVPVVTPLGTGVDDQHLYNINADFAAAANRIRDEYRKKEFPDVKVTPLVEPISGSDGAVSVTMQIEEGDRKEIGEYLFEGNANVEADVLRETFGSFPWWNPLGWFTDTPVTPQDLAEARDKVAEHYRNLGYLDVAVSPAERVPGEDAGESDILFRINEGPRYKVRSMSVSGVKTYPEAAALASVKAVTSGAVAGEKFQELFFANAKDEAIIEYLKTLLA